MRIQRESECRSGWLSLLLLGPSLPDSPQPRARAGTRQIAPGLAPQRRQTEFRCRGKETPTWLRFGSVEGPRPRETVPIFRLREEYPCELPPAPFFIRCGGKKPIRFARA